EGGRFDFCKRSNGETNADNLAFTCWRYNRHNGTDLGSFDPQTERFSFLFNPRTQQWMEHFIFQDLTIVGLTAEGCTTVRLLQLNNQERIAERQRIRDRAISSNN
ncbi:MAG TPA: hypothetical protein DEG47_04605, partial [Cyanobacteria bacterium UBA11148]|nr:hypothetical protein [Cyanobacteria bacterium UBA11148]